MYFTVHMVPSYMQGAVSEFPCVQTVSPSHLFTDAWFTEPGDTV